MLIAIAVIFGILLGVVLAGVTGFLFRVWPTSMPDSDLVVTPEVIRNLKSLRAEPKFGPDPKRFYPGATNEATRKGAEQCVNIVIDYLIVELQKTPKKSFVLAAFKHFLPAFEHFDSEEMDETLHYLGQTMRILGIDGSNELLNVWRYGFPYGWVRKGG